MENENNKNTNPQTSIIEKKEAHARWYMNAVTVLGAAIALGSLYFLEIPWSFSILLLLVVFLFITEHFAIPVWKGAITLGFPVIFTVDLLFGLSVALVTYTVVVATIHRMQQRPLSIITFNPAQLVISLAVSKGVALAVTDSWGAMPDSLTGLLVYTAVYTFVFYFVNHLLVDIVLWLRPQPFPLNDFMKKISLEFIGMVLSYFYLLLFFVLGNQDRGDVVDVFSFFFFFSPLVAMALIGSSNFKLRREKERLEGLVTISEELNRHIPEKDWLSGIEQHLKKVFEFDALSIWMKRKGEWQCELDTGEGTPMPARKEVERMSEKTKSITAVMSIERDPWWSTVFHKAIRSAVVCPMYDDGEMHGLIIIGRRRAQETRPDELKVVKALANQLEVITKGRTLIIEREQRMILEERNRIAREIHDGIAQSVAGTVMQLETAKRKAAASPDQALDTLTYVLPGLRKSLTEIRESIYALRPFPTDAQGLLKAVKEETGRIRNEHPDVEIELKWKEAPGLAPEKEKLVYNTFKESIQNAMKHADADKVVVSGVPGEEGGFLLTVSDNGKGFLLKDALIKSRKGKHFGILNMNEEAAKAEAVLQIESRPGEGTMIELHLPGSDERRNDDA
ncbi:hypothetical protein CR205_18505 [Alteribacter lacisalsi]|uniref:histidine kinase n=1 Tax=Alteribacter lacisalsi TaxID=2045244 RepID=A0A2W0H158_9BACI|nr:GAF domain-containing sensor histidine kinase [Alteribacter lacisalsi]PYZ95523.1 hypothetical protein CR205_18505 [Alteribacter lacisalsi]